MEPHSAVFGGHQLNGMKRGDGAQGGNGGGGKGWGRQPGTWLRKSAPSCKGVSEQPEVPALAESLGGCSAGLQASREFECPSYSSFLLGRGCLRRGSLYPLPSRRRVWAGDGSRPALFSYDLFFTHGST